MSANHLPISEHMVSAKAASLILRGVMATGQPPDTFLAAEHRAAERQREELADMLPRLGASSLVSMSAASAGKSRTVSASASAGTSSRLKGKMRDESAIRDEEADRSDPLDGLCPPSKKIRKS